MFPNKDTRSGFGESSVSLGFIQHRSPPPIDTGGNRSPADYQVLEPVRAFVPLPTPLDIELAGQGTYRSSPPLPALCYLGGTIIFLCGEARCQESPEQDGEVEWRSDPLSARRGWGRPGEALPSLAWGPILQWRVPFQEEEGEQQRPRGARLGGKKPWPRNDSGAPSEVCGWPVHSFLPWVSHLSRAVFGCFPENSGSENYQVDHLLSFWFLVLLVT